VSSTATISAIAKSIRHITQLADHRHHVNCLHWITLSVQYHRHEFTILPALQHDLLAQLCPERLVQRAWAIVGYWRPDRQFRSALRGRAHPDPMAVDAADDPSRSFGSSDVHFVRAARSHLSPILTQPLAMPSRAMVVQRCNQRSGRSREDVGNTVRAPGSRPKAPRSPSDPIVQPGPPPRFDIIDELCDLPPQ
jgi:hypothetical protein